MIRRAVAALALIAGLYAPAAAQERVTVGTQRLMTNAALFLAAAKGYFKAEGLDLVMTAYPSPQAVVEALSIGTNDFAVTDFTARAFALAGQGTITAIAAQSREKQFYDGNFILASNAASTLGLRRLEDLTGRSFAIDQFGSSTHYQVGRIARAKSIKFESINLRPVRSLDAMASAIISGEADATILPAQIARGILGANQAKLLGWYSELDELQLGALFTSAKTIQGRRATVEKFLRAYRRGAADFVAALLRHDSKSKHVADARSRAAAAAIAHYIYPKRSNGAGAVEDGVFFMDADARLDIADIERQVDWFKAQGLVDKAIDPRAVVDLSFTK